MTHILVFNLVLAIVCTFAFRFGGGPERLTAILFAVAAAASFLVPDMPYYSYFVVEPIRLVIDGLLATGLVVIALRADRFWPLYISALQIVALAIHGAKAYEPELVPWMYAAATGKIAYPMLILLTAGVIRHRERVQRLGNDRDWSSLTPAA